MKFKKMITKMLLVLAVTVVAAAPLQMLASQTSADAATKTTKVKKAKKANTVKNSKHALKIVLKKINPNKKTGVFYMTTKISKTTYQVEARKSTGSVAKLKGMYRLNTKTLKVTKMNLNTGKFVAIK